MKLIIISIFYVIIVGKLLFLLIDEKTKENKKNYLRLLTQIISIVYGFYLASIFITFFKK